MFRNYLRNLSLYAGAAIAGVTITAAGLHAQPLVPPSVPGIIQAPAGNTPFLKAAAIGTQNYVCLPSGAGMAWKFQGPQATLLITYRWVTGEVRQQVASHFLSPNPGEAGEPARATWLSSLDTSSVWAKKIQESSDPAFVAPGAIPWFLLQAAGAQTGPMGGSMLAQTTYIQRVNTTGGGMPTASCTEAGSLSFVPYTADYIFYRSSETH